MEAAHPPADVKERTEEQLRLHKEKLQRIVEKLGVFVMKQRTQRKEEPDQINEHIYLGSYSAACNKEFLKDKGIKHVLMCLGHLPLPFPGEFNYKQISVKGSIALHADCEEEDIRQHFQTGCDFIEEAVANGEKILVHW